MSDIEKLSELVRRHSEGVAAFSPCAFYDDRLDCIRIIARDCSLLEERINDRITVLVDAHYPRPGMTADQRYVGFTIKGARHFCKENGLASGTIKVMELLDAVLKTCPEVVVQLVVEYIARPLVEQKKIEQVDLPEPVLQTA